MRLLILCFILANVALAGAKVDGGGVGSHPQEKGSGTAAGFAMDLSSSMVGLAADDAAQAGAVARLATRAAISGSTNDKLSEARMAAGWGMGRKMLGERAAKGANNGVHDPEALASAAVDDAHHHAVELMAGGSNIDYAIHKSQIDAEHATVADVEDLKLILAGLDRKRRLGERDRSNPSDNTQLQGALTTSSHIMQAVSDQGTARGATKMGSETTLAAGTDRGYDTPWHISADTTTEGPLTRQAVVALDRSGVWDHIPTWGWGDFGIGGAPKPLNKRKL